MSRTPDQIHAGLLALQPSGWALPDDPDTYYAATFRPMAEEYALIEQAMESFEAEIDPATAVRLLPDYLRVLGPDPYGRDDLVLSEAQQQQIAHQRWVDAPVICAGYFIAAAAALGETITITEYPLPVCGGAVCGDVLSPAGSQLVFTVTLPADTVWDPRCGATVCGDSLGSFTPSLIEGFIRARAPLWTQPVFSYTG